MEGGYPEQGGERMLAGQRCNYREENPSGVTKGALEKDDIGAGSLLRWSTSDLGMQFNLMEGHC